MKISLSPLLILRNPHLNQRLPSFKTHQRLPKLNKGPERNRTQSLISPYHQAQSRDKQSLEQRKVVKKINFITRLFESEHFWLLVVLVWTTIMINNIWESNRVMSRLCSEILLNLKMSKTLSLGHYLRVKVGSKRWIPM
jgi:hypothetical protein